MSTYPTAAGDQARSVASGAPRIETAVADLAGFAHRLEALGSADVPLDAAGVLDALGALVGLVRRIGRGALEGAADPGLAQQVLACAADVAAAVDTDRLTDRGLCDHAVAMDVQVSRCQGRVAGLVAEVDRREAFREDGCVTTGSWWRHRTRRDPNRAATFARAARRLRRLEATSQALADGRIGWRHARIIAEAATARRRDAIEGAEETLVDLASRHEPRAVRTACKRIADTVDRDQSALDGSHDCAADGGGPDPRREMYLAQSFEGLWDLRATLDPITGERFHGLLDALTDPDPPGAPIEEQRTPAQRRHDGFDRLLRLADEHPDVPSVQGSRPHVLLMVDVRWLLGADPVWGPRLASGEDLDYERACELIQDASITTVGMWGPFRPAGVGRTQRALPGWLRPVLHAVHGTCRGPGCDRPAAWTQAAHLEAWDDGGPTDLDNILPLCHAHHRMLDNTDWTCHFDRDTAICTWTSPDGHRTIRTRPPDP